MLTPQNKLAEKQNGTSKNFIYPTYRRSPISIFGCKRQLIKNKCKSKRFNVVSLPKTSLNDKLVECIKSYISDAKWDSDNFKIKVGHVILENAENICMELIIARLKEIIFLGKKEQYKLLYFKCPSNILISERILPEAKIVLADTKVIYSKRLVSQNINNAIDGVLNCQETEVNDDLLCLAFESGKYSRFKLDVNFPSGVFEKMYTTWMERSIKKEIADEVLVYKDQNSTLGMLTYSASKECLTIGLIAVDNNHQGKHIGSKLMTSLESIAYSSGLNRIEVATQKANLPACRFYEKNNFTIKESIIIYHIWL